MSNESSNPLVPQLPTKRRWYSFLLAPFRRFLQRKVTQVHRRFFDWYCDSFYDLRSGLSETEWAYVQACFDIAEVFAEVAQDSGYDEYSYFTYSHRVKGNHVNSSRFAYGSVANPAETLEAALPVIQERNVPLDPYFVESPNSLFYGLGWDLEANQFKVYFRVLSLDDMPFPSLQELLETAMEREQRRDEGLVSFTYVNNELYEEKVYVYPQPEAAKYHDIFPGTKGRAVMATSRRGNITQYDVSTTKLWRQKLNATGREIVDLYARRGYTLDTIAMTDQDNFTLYFPGAFYPFMGTLSKIQQRFQND
ncbi:MAG: hypothetical protein EP343_17580 [Deltaproteobacteria bacterium]|nr:MAG: hypothetical protein EP343_17580 [Deltaproteobacteria bacterium]